MKLQNMYQNYSTLELTEHDHTTTAPELVRRDVTARAPERDYDATACELDVSALAPQVRQACSSIYHRIIVMKVYRLYLMTRRKCSTIARCLRSTVKIASL